MQYADDADGLDDLFPFIGTAGPGLVVEIKLLIVGTHADDCHRLSVFQPLPSSAPAWAQAAGTVKLVHVNEAVFLHFVAAPAARSA